MTDPPRLSLHQEVLTVILITQMFTYSYYQSVAWHQSACSFDKCLIVTTVSYFYTLIAAAVFPGHLDFELTSATKQ